MVSSSGDGVWPVRVAEVSGLKSRKKCATNNVIGRESTSQQGYFSGRRRRDIMQYKT